MAVSKRERYIIVATVAAVALFAFDRYALTPLLDRRAGAELEVQEALRRMEHASDTFAQSKRMRRMWQEMQAASLSGDTGAAESALLRALRDWSRDSGLALSSLKPERPAQEGLLPSVAVQVVGGGTMENAARFLWLVETSELPLRIEQMQIGTRKEGSDDLSLQLRLTALYTPREAGHARAAQSAADKFTGGSP